MNQIESWFENLSIKMTQSVKIFSASLFLLVSIGMIYGIYFAEWPLMLLIPPLLAILAYYSRTSALVVLVLTVIAFVWH